MSLAALQCSGIETAGIAGVRQSPAAAVGGFEAQAQSRLRT